jgi:hypothetical protein
MKHAWATTRDERLTDVPDSFHEPDNSGPDSAKSRPSGIPRWVKVSGIIAVVAILALVLFMVISGHRGPSRHIGGLSGSTVQSSAIYGSHDALPKSDPG